MNEKTLRTLEYDKVIQRLKHFAVSSRGGEIIEELRPINSKERINMLLQETDEGVRMILSNGSIPLDGFHDLSTILQKAKINSLLSLKDLLHLAATLRVVASVLKYCGEIAHKEEFPILGNLITSFEDLRELEKEISRAVISEDELSDRASHELFQIRRAINRKNQNIKDRLNAIITSPSYQKYLQDQIITIRQERYVLPVKQEYRSNVAGIIHDQSSTGATLFIEPMIVVEMNNDLKKLKLQEAAEIERILRAFTENVALNHLVLSSNYNTLLQLDVIFAKAKYALEIHGVLPIVNEDMSFHLINARHPLIEPDKVVPSNIYLGENFNTLVVTGPNTGGKTVALKTVGLMCLMVQAGLFIPVKSQSSICIFKNIFADIGDEQSIEQSLSTFSSHMTNIVQIIREVEENTLVLLDELGAGTDPTEGAALAMAILDYLRSRKVSTLVTTHYSELKQYAISQDGVENASVEFDVETLSPTYRLLIGVPGKSNAFAISKRLGLIDEIIDNSKAYISEENIQFEDILRDIEKRNKETEQNYYESEKIKEDMESSLKQLEEEKSNLEEKKREIELKAKEDALKIVEEANEQALEIIKEMNRIKAVNKESAAKLEAYKRELKEQENKLHEEVTQRRGPIKRSQKPFKPGDRVLIASLNQKGYILSIGQDGLALVEVGIIKTKVKVADLVHIEEESSQKKSYSRKAINSKARTIKTSVDLRGMTTEEAILDVEKFIDDAVLANLAQITIIHGKGTGALRQAVHDLLKRNKYVDEYRIGNYNEGGTGATIATLK
ncbi:DNA mismatch repair protein MutS2 [Alkalibaculum bacchi]|uniref:Endonuclease MutS2 n=1 Tax=Alkalibaculum bacchi TaxID=645887 RepID=A0A366IE61_9FIRM|nr:endonuclease MutS2 [Alkalibaculum bacchi]RBP68373.1 DNA mismatch repair protein MutS2 [Alkalibaculum bacchi]